MSGVQFHAGHYRPAGSNPALRFNEYNIHKQSAGDNNHKSGNLTAYRKELIKRIGLKHVEWLERQDHPTPKLTLDDLKDITEYYNDKFKLL